MNLLIFADVMLSQFKVRNKLVTLEVAVLLSSQRSTQSFPDCTLVSSGLRFVYNCESHFKVCSAVDLPTLFRWLNDMSSFASIFMQDDVTIQCWCLDIFFYHSSVVAMHASTPIELNLLGVARGESLCTLLWRCNA
jgi:hypothetical protein